jgi:hypothetical protein
MFTVVKQFIYVASITRCRHFDYNSYGDRPIKKTRVYFFVVGVSPMMRMMQISNHGDVQTHIFWRQTKQQRKETRSAQSRS